MDTIRLVDLRVLTVIGALASEQLAPQPCEVDAILHLDLAPAGVSDDLERTVDYGAVLDAFAEIALDRHVLLERFAERLCDAALCFGTVESVEIEVRKLRPPVPHDIASTGVRVQRCRVPAAGSS